MYRTSAICAMTLDSRPAHSLGMRGGIGWQSDVGSVTFPGRSRAHVALQR